MTCREGIGDKGIGNALPHGGENAAGARHDDVYAAPNTTINIPLRCPPSILHCSPCGMACPLVPTAHYYQSGHLSNWILPGCHPSVKAKNPRLALCLACPLNKWTNRQVNFGFPWLLNKRYRMLYCQLLFLPLSKRSSQPKRERVTKPLDKGRKGDRVSVLPSVPSPPTTPLLRMSNTATSTLVALLRLEFFILWRQ